MSGKDPSIETASRWVVAQRMNGGGQWEVIMDEDEWGFCLEWSKCGRTALSSRVIELWANTQQLGWYENHTLIKWLKDDRSIIPVRGNSPRCIYIPLLSTRQQSITPATWGQIPKFLDDLVIVGSGNPSWDRSGVISCFSFAVDEADTYKGITEAKRDHSGNISHVAMHPTWMLNLYHVAPKPGESFIQKLKKKKKGKRKLPDRQPTN